MSAHEVRERRHFKKVTFTFCAK